MFAPDCPPFPPLFRRACSSSLLFDGICQPGGLLRGPRFSFVRQSRFESHTRQNHRAFALDQRTISTAHRTPERA
jgi:hypothetical protein